MAQQDIRIRIYARPASWMADGYYLTFHEIEPWTGEFPPPPEHAILLAETSVAVNMPSKADLAVAEIAKLRAERNKVSAEFGKKLADIDLAIQNLLALENQA